MKKSGGVFIAVRDSDKPEIVGVAKKFVDCGFSIYATKGTARFLATKGFSVQTVEKIRECPDNNTATLLESGKISYIVATSEKGRDPANDDVKIRRKACTLGIPCLTSVDTANALVGSLLSGYGEINTELIDINRLRRERVKLSFTKMHGCGNDYIYFNCMDDEINSPESLSILLSDRHIGVGGDGIVLIGRSDIADARMRIFYIDGNEGDLCGNAVRCVAKYLHDNRIVNKLQMKIETRAGTKDIYLSTRNGLVSSVKVNMGRAGLRAEQFPDNPGSGHEAVKPITIGDTECVVAIISMSSSHAVVFCAGVDELDLDNIGKAFEKNDAFLSITNFEFVEVIGRNHLKMRIWERSKGETSAYCEGACASAVAAVHKGYCDGSADVKVQLLGGELIIKYTDNAVYMTGDCKKVFDGTVEI